MGYHCDDVAVLTLSFYPMRIIFVGNGREANRDAHLVTTEQKIFKNLSGSLFCRLEEDSQIEVTVDVRLTNIKDKGIVLREDLHERSGYAGAISSLDCS